MPANYFLGSRLLASTIAYHNWDDTTPEPNSEAFFCPQCGDIWGRIVESLGTIHYSITRPCASHGNGSFIAPWRTTFDELPLEVLRYEFLLRADNTRKPSA